jgi:uncharacterized membrane-anchored protein
LGKVRGNRNFNNAGRVEKRQAILAALAKATADCSSLAGSAGEHDDETNGYYSLTHEEIEALINGDIEKIESWVSSLDRRHATRLLRWLIKEQG